MSNRPSFYGSQHVPWHKVFDLLEHLVTPGHIAIRHAKGLEPLGQTLRYFVESHESRIFPHKITLEELIYISGDRAASDPRDYIYALLGLVEPQTNLFEPDYSRSEFWAYQHAMVHITRCRQNLYFLSLRSGQQIMSERSRRAQSGRMVSRARL